MYRWEWPPLLIPRIYNSFATLHVLWLSYSVLSLLQFDPSAGVFHIISHEPLCESEKRWLATNLAVLLGQLSLLACMWTPLRSKISKKAIKVDFVVLEKLLPKWGFIRGSHSLYTYLFSPKGPYTSLVTLAGAASALFLLRWWGIQVYRLITILHALIYLDAWSCLYMQTGQAVPDLTWIVIGNVEDTPHAGITMLVYLGTHLPLIFYGYGYLLSLLPALSFALLLRFLLVPYAPRYIVKPIPQSVFSDPPIRRFCKVCEDTVLAGLRNGGKDENLGAFQPHQPTIRSLRNSAMEGCRVCVAVWEKMCTVPPDWGVSYIFFMKHATSWERLSGDVIMNCKWSYNLCQLGEISVTDGFAPCAEEDLQDHTGSPSSLQKAKEWLSTCMLEHPGCNEGRDPGFRPSRLLYLGDDQQIRLHTLNDYPARASYLTLSHCWGGAQFIKLQENNLEGFKEEIPWNALPQTFQDAIQVVRHLGFKYLWIDSLCILQDSALDWMTESKMMGSVYKNAVCNIAASDAANSRQGCLYPRNRRIVTPEPLQTSGTEDSKAKYLVNTSGIVDRFDRLYSRAWVLQEVLLARRTLDCARDQLFWRCDKLVASEELPRGVGLFNSHRMYHPSRDIMGTTSDVSSLRAMSAQMQKWQADNRKAFQTEERLGQSTEYLSAHYGSNSPSGYWASIVEIYSRMSITHDTDRPIALSGIIETFRPILGEYWAGMWQHLLPGHLVWSIRRFSDLHDRVRSRCYRPSTKRAPSWSWLSLEGTIYYREMSEYHRSYEGDDGEKPEDKVLAELVDVEVLSAEDIRLRLRAPMIQATWVGLPTDTVSTTLRAIGFKAFDSGPNVVDVDWVPKWRLPRCEQSDGGPETYIKLVFDVAEEETQVRDVSLVAIRTRLSMTEGLVLQRRKDGVFTRVGRFTAWEPAAKVIHESDRVEFVLA